MHRNTFVIYIPEARKTSYTVKDGSSERMNKIEKFAHNFTT